MKKLSVQVILNFIRYERILSHGHHLLERFLVVSCPLNCEFFIAFVVIAEFNGFMEFFELLSLSDSKCLFSPPSFS
jgi:hypothetical protein